MTPSTTTTTAAQGAATLEATRFRCSCGRSVAAQRGSAAADSGRCSSCRSRHHAESSLRLRR